MPARFADIAPRPVYVEEAGEEQWKVGDVFIEGVGRHAVAGWKEFAPSYPKTLADADPASYDAKARLERLDEFGIHAQVLYPNIIAFSAPEFVRVGEDFALACVRAWNDFLAEWCEADPNRLLPMMMLPFWNVEQSIEEMHRAIGIGHKGIILAAHMERGGYPPLWEPLWEPLFAAAQEAGMSINFHVGLSMPNAKEHANHWQRPIDDNTVATSQYMLGNAKAVAEVACRGICHKFPDLRFVSVESGVSWLPYLMENLDWHWKNYGGLKEMPERELPSFYIRRQVYSTYWFENQSIRDTVTSIADNVMFESDFPHTTSLSPGPASYAELPRTMAEKSMEGLPEDVVRKVFYENAAKVYNLPALVLATV
jgi:predicted TIM-barrel fold metal-dependent hydrolase